LALFFGLNQRELIQTKDLSITYENKRINFPDLDISPGNHFLILGRSGSGKTSFLNLIGGLLSPSSGQIKINNKNIALLSSNELDKFRGLNIGFIFQTPHFIKSLNINDNLLLSQYFLGNRDQNHINTLLEKVELLNRKEDPLHELSEGEKQRISIVRALINKPKIILADEPTSALDDYSCNIVIDLLKNLSKENNSVLIIVTHDKRLKDKFKQFIDLDAS
jgi:ABC-type lipoprotein export system ATPase subunit